MSKNIIKTYMFRGKVLKPFSKGRLSMAMAAGIRFQKETMGPNDILAIIFICSCSAEVRVLAQVSPVQFWLKFEEWVEENEMMSSEGLLEASNVVTEMLTATLETEAEPLPAQDLSFTEDPHPN